MMFDSGDERHQREPLTQKILHSQASFRTPTCPSITLQPGFWLTASQTLCSAAAPLLPAPFGLANLPFAVLHPLFQVAPPPFAALLQWPKSLYSPNAGPLIEKSSVSSTKNSRVIVSGHSSCNRSCISLAAKFLYQKHHQDSQQWKGCNGKGSKGEPCTNTFE